MQSDKTKLIAAFVGGLLLMLLLLVAGAYLVVVSGCIDPGADQSIPPLERWAAKTSLHAYLNGHTPQTKNPLPASNENLAAGCRLYVNNCAVCHGLADNEKSNIAQGFYKGAPLFAKADWSDDPDGLVYWFIEHGVRLTAMPAYSESLKDDEKWQLVMFIKHITKLPEPVQKQWEAVKTLEVAK